MLDAGRSEAEIPYHRLEGDDREFRIDIVIPEGSLLVWIKLCRQQQRSLQDDFKILFVASLRDAKSVNKIKYGI